MSTKTKTKEKEQVKKPVLRLKESNHYSAMWIAKEQVELRTGTKSDVEFYILTIEGNEIMLGKKAYINLSKDGTKIGFHIQNSREYRIFGTSEMITGKDLIQYNIQLNTFNKQNK